MDNSRTGPDRTAGRTRRTGGRGLRPLERAERGCQGAPRGRVGGKHRVGARVAWSASQCA